MINYINLISYFIYIGIVAYVTIWVGKDLHQNGRFFIALAIGERNSAIDQINNILLIGYYLLNIGFALLKIKNWNILFSASEMIASLSENIGQILLLLGSIHVFNVATLSILYFTKTKSKP